MAGRRPKPDGVKQLAGNPGKRKLKKTVGKPQGHAKCPEWLDEDAQREWQRLQADMQLIGLLSNIEQTAFAAYCQAVSAWLKSTKTIIEKGLTYEANGLVKVRPEVKIAKEMAAEIRKWCVEFGITPASRSRVSPSPQLSLPGVPENPNPPKSGDEHERHFGVVQSVH